MWRLWAALVAAFFFALVAHYALKPDLGLSPITLSVHGNIWTASFQTANNTDAPISAVLHVIIEAGSGGKGKQSVHVDIAREALTVSLAPRERKTVACDFPLPLPFRPPNAARIEVTSYNTQRE